MSRTARKKKATKKVVTPVRVCRASVIDDSWCVWDTKGIEVDQENEIGNFDRIIRTYGYVNGDNPNDIIFTLQPNGRTRVLYTNLEEANRRGWENQFPSHPISLKSSVTTAPAAPTLDITDTIHKSYSRKPRTLILEETKWKYLVRSVLRGKNLMITGPTGCGKTLAVTSVAKAINHQLFYFNLGATQDPRSTLIGNTHYDKDTGTYFAQSTFVKAIQTPNSVILLDELSRAHPEAWNILMSVLDETQKYLRIDEDPDTPIINVASGVCFLATANIGMEYTSTRVIDRAILDRFQILEMDQLTTAQQDELIQLTYPDVEPTTVKPLSLIYSALINEVKSGASKISTNISTRTILESVGLLTDGFTLKEAAEVCIYPYFSTDGGLDSERTYVRQLVQKFIPDDRLQNDNIFTAQDVADESLI